MKTCSFPGCGNNLSKRPDLIYFPLPQNPARRGEWLEILSPRKRETSSAVVCELHFKGKDFKAGKKELKIHAVPSSDTGVDSLGSDDNDFIVYEPPVDVISIDVDPEIPAKEFDKPEASTQPEIETGRRPSRRAALVAAKKIHESAASYSLKIEPEKSPARITASPRPPSVSPLPPSPLKKTKFASSQHDLLMECNDDILSTAQAEALLSAQVHYNGVMRNLRDLTSATNVKIVQTDAYGNPLPPPPPPPKPTPKNVKADVSSKVVKSQTLKVVPLKLIAARTGANTTIPIILL